MVLTQRPTPDEDDAESSAAHPAGSTPGSPRSARHHRRRWPWVLGAIGAVLAACAIYLIVTWDPAHQVSMGEAEQRLGNQDQGVVAGARPAQGVYLYTGSGTDRLSLPPLSQAQGPTMPGTVTLQGKDCWTFRMDYSSHHWASWRLCRQGDDTVERGGQNWQMWVIGPLHETNMTNLTCAAGTMWLPSASTPGRTWQNSCRGTSTAVQGVMHSAGPYRFAGTTTLIVGGKPVQTAQFVEVATDSGAQRGTERNEMWLDETSGLPVRMAQDISVVTDTPFGTSTYTQTGTFTLQSLTAHG